MRKNNLVMRYMVKIVCPVLLMLFACANVHGSYYDTFSGIIIWTPEENIVIEDFASKRVTEMQEKLQIEFVIPFDKFECYYWDEQILVMDEKDYDRGYYVILNYFSWDYDEYLFFSFVIDGDIVLTGLNRLCLPDHKIRKGDRDYSIPKIINYYGNEKQKVVFRLSFYKADYSDSIYKQAEELIQDTGIFFNDRVYRYFEKRNKIIRGRIDNIDDIIFGYNARELRE